MKNKIICFALCLMLVGMLAAPTASADGDAALDLLARAVEAEAGGESYTVMVSLASMLLNRVESGSYPGSLAAVVSDAGIDISSAEPTSRAYRAAKDALGGFDPTSGALGYSKSALTDVPLLLGVDGWSFY